MSRLYEIHVTTQIDNQERLDSFKNICLNFKSTKCPYIQSCKPIVIKLDRGTFSTQPMCAISVFAKIEHVFNIMKLFAQTLTENGFIVRREKIELKLFETLKTQYDKAGIHFPSEFKPEYFEFHCGITMASDDDSENFDIKHAHLSRSALSNKPDNFRIVTFRNKNTRSYLDFFGEIEHFLQDLAAWSGCEQILKTEYELCVYDNFIELDNGWLN